MISLMLAIFFIAGLLVTIGLSIMAFFGAILVAIYTVIAGFIGLFI